MTAIRAIITDIEGTTTSDSFVHDVLFPYARRHLADHVRAHGAELAGLLDEVRAVEGTPSMDVATCIDTLLRWMDEDRKITPLKALQGMIWKNGYEAGDFLAHLFADTAPALRRWKAMGLALHVYSSGSVEAQRLLFAHTEEGDLTPLFSGWFDTRTGPKKEAASYARIAREIGLAPEQVLFLSDNPAELAAAREAGLAVIGLARPGNIFDLSAWPSARSFDDVDPVLAHAGAD